MKKLISLALVLIMAFCMAIPTFAADADAALTDEQIAQITALMEKISQFDYDVNALNKTLNNLMGKGEGFFSGLVESIKGLFGGDSDGGIINNTKDELLGDGAVIDSTIDAVKDTVKKAEEEGFFDKIIQFFNDLMGSDNSEDTNEEHKNRRALSSPPILIH